MSTYKKVIYKQNEIIINEYIALRYLNSFLNKKRNKTLADKVNYINIKSKISELSLLLRTKKISIQRLDKCLKYIESKNVNVCDDIDNQIIQNFMSNNGPSINLAIDKDLNETILSQVKNESINKANQIKTGIIFKKRKNEIAKNLLTRCMRISKEIYDKNKFHRNPKLEAFIKDYLNKQLNKEYTINENN